MFKLISEMVTERKKNLLVEKSHSLWIMRLKYDPKTDISESLINFSDTQCSR